MHTAHPVRSLIVDYRSRTNPSERLDALLLAFEVLIRIDCLLLIADFLRDDSSRDDKIRNLILREKKLTLGEWCGLLEALVAVAGHEHLSDVRTWFLAMKRSSARDLERLSAVRNPRAHREDRTQVQFVSDSLSQAEPLFGSCIEQHPELGYFEELEKGRLLYTRTDGGSEAGPFVLAGSLVGQPDAILIYTGRSVSKLEYASVPGRRKEYWSAETYHEVIDVLSKKFSPLEFVDATAPGGILGDRMVDTTRQALNRLTELRVYRSHVTLPRQEANIMLQGFLEGPQRLLLIEGPAGAGKTNCLCQTAEQRINEENLVLLATGDHLPNASFPECFGALLRIKERIATALNRLGTLSKDGKVVFLVDEPGAAGSGYEALLSILHWSEHLVPTSPIKIVVTLGSELMRTFMSEHREGLPESLGRLYHLTPFSAPELVVLAQTLPVPEAEPDPEGLAAARLGLAQRMGQIAQSSIRRPAVAIAILESATSTMVPSSFSAATAYRELFRRVVLDVVYGQMPKSLRRAPMVLKLAESLIERQSVKIAADDEALHHSGLLDDRTGQRSRDYQLLLSAEILAERLEEYVSYVSFVDPRFLAFVAAASMPLERLNQLVSGLSQRSTGFPLALTVAAFLLIRALDALQPRRIWDCIKDLASHREAIFIEMSLLDRDSFLAVFECGIISERHLALSVVDSLILAGEPSLAADAAHLVATLVTEDLDVLEHAHFLRARALYEIDDRSAEDELSFVKSKKAVAALGLQAEICSSRGNFPQARNAYEALLERITSLDLRERADILCGLAYVLGKVGESEQAETRFQEAIGLLQPLGDSQLLAETLSCQGQFLSESNRPSEARKCLLKSLTMNQRLGILVGIGIVEGLLGDLDLVEGDVAAAEVRLNKSLEIALRVGNRWREAWVLGRIGKVYMAKGQIGEATSCLRESQKLFDIIGSTQQ